jgi:DNA polymerase-3 subunit delta'
MWEGLVGQERAIERMTLAARRPAHAYLIVGSRGAGAEEAARGFAALLVAPDDDASAGRVCRGVHPDVVEFEPGATAYRIKEDVLERIIPESLSAPVEADRKVLLLFEAERLRGNRNESANALLKTLEEPPPRTVIVLVTGLPDDLLPTIRSRCQRIDLDPVSDSDARAALEREGVDSDAAALAVTLSGGQLARARALAGPVARLRATFASIPALVDGRGSTAVELAAEADSAVEEAYAHVTERHQAELAELDARLDAEHYEGRDAKRQRVRVEERQKREARRARLDLLLEGVTAVETVYRDALAAPADPLNTDRDPIALSPRACVEALDLCRAAREAFLLNEKGTLRLEHLCMSLPPAAAGAAAHR